jgi:hypothetical protein
MNYKILKEPVVVYLKTHFLNLCGGEREAVNTVMITGKLGEIRTLYLPYPNLELYQNNNLLDQETIRFHGVARHFLTTIHYMCNLCKYIIQYEV